MQNIRSAEAATREVSVGESRFDDSRVVAAVGQYLAALESGCAPDRREFVARHPEIASELEDCLGALQLVHGAAAEVRFELTDEPVDAPSSKVLGDFRLLREIGRGGMGVVYEAVQISLNRRVAVKVLPFATALDQTHLQRFRNEAQAAAQLHHTNIVPVYAVGAERGVHFYAMQLIEGEPLGNLIAYLRQLAGKEPAAETQGRVKDGDCPTRSLGGAAVDLTDAYGLTNSTTTAAASPSSARLVAGNAGDRGRYRLAAELMRQAALGLEHAHQFGVVHRDVKPANLLVNEHANVWITDFGLAHIQADVSLTRTGDVLGTVRYMSPEQAVGNRVILDHRTDIYSLGATFYELLTLEPVFAESDRHVLVRRIIEEEPRSLLSVDAAVPLELETIVLKAMAKAPQDRYATAKQFADDLERWLGDKPILARRPTVREQAIKWCRRHRSLVRTAAVFLALAFGGLLASTILIAREQSKTSDAYRREMNQRLAADESFRQARQAVDAFTQLGEQELAGDPSLQPLRRKFLETALEYYQSFLNQRRDDPLVKAELTATSDRVEKLIDDLAVVEGFAALPLLRDRGVQEELLIPDAQRRQIEQSLRQLETEHERARGGHRSSDPASRQGQLAEVLRAQQERIAKLINPPQMLRLKQIYWQRQGPFAFLSSEVAAALALTTDQRTSIRQIIDEENPERDIRTEPGDMRRSRPRVGSPPAHGPLDRGTTGGGPPGPRPFDGGPLDDGPFDADRPPPPRPGEFGEARRGPRRPAPPQGPRGPLGPGGAARHAGPRGSAGSGHGPEGDPLREMMDQAVERILRLLTDEQCRTWQTLIGQPFAAELRLPPGERMPH